MWRHDLVVAPEQVFPKADAAEVARADGAAIRARVAGRDPGTNVVALQLESPIEFDRPEPADPALGALVLALAADAGGAPTVRLASYARSGLLGTAAAVGNLTGELHLILIFPAVRKEVPSSTLPALCWACRPPARLAARLSSRLRRLIVSSRAPRDGADCPWLARGGPLSGSLVRSRLPANRAGSRADGPEGSRRGSGCCR